MTSAQELYQDGQLDAAIAALNASVKAKPSAVQERAFLAELLCFAGNLERADLLLDQLGVMTPDLTVPLALFRQLVRGEKSRGEVFGSGRVPEFVGTPPEWLTQHLQALVALREGRPTDALALISSAEALRPVIKGAHNDVEFEGMRDLDDLTAGFFEVLTSTGKYFWIPLDQVREAEFEPPKQARDLYWRQCRMVVADGPDGVVYVPALYAGSSAATDPSLRLGRTTDWQEVAAAPVRGVGQREYLLGEESVPVLELGMLFIDPPAEG